MQVASRPIEVKDLDGLFRTFEEIGDVKESLHALLEGLQETELSPGQKGLVKLLRSYCDILFRLVDQGLDEFLTVVKPTEDPLSRFPLPEEDNGA